MIKRTDMSNPEDLLKKLKSINNKFLPIVKTEFTDPNEHISEFLNLFKIELDGETNGLLLVNPVFNLFYDWSEWKLKGFQDIYYLAYTDNNIHNDKYSIQREISKKGTSTKILDSINGKDGRTGNVGIVISINQGEQDCLVCPVSTDEELAEGVWRFCIEKTAFDKRKSLYKCKDIPAIIKNAGEIYPFKKKELVFVEDDKVDLSGKRDWEFYGDIIEAIYNNSIYIDKEHDIYFIISTPVRDVKANNDKGLGGVFFILNNKEINNTNNKDVISAMKQLTEKLSIRMIHYYENEEKLRNALRAAVSQVMARNMSHNIGSHVLNNLTDGSALSKITNYECKSYKPCSKLIDLKEESSIIYQLAIYNNYVKCRMDYLADITFGTPVMSTNKKVYTELYKDLDRVRLLLDNISGLSNNFPFEIKFTLNDTTITTQNDFCIGLPNDLLGCQAFYNIIENLIRNTAKHNQNKSGTTEFTINFKEIAEQLNNVADKEPWYEVEIYDDAQVLDIAALIKSQNEKINLSVLDEKHNNQLRNSSLGLLEMEASAAYLRKLDIANIEDDAFDVEYDNKFNNKHGSINILKAINKNGALGYRFFVSKPTEFLFVGDFNEITPGRQTELLKMGIWFRTPDDFKKEVMKESGTVFNHQFIFHQSVQFIKDFEKEENRKYKTQLPVRIVELNEKTNCLLTLLITKEVAFEKIEECVWQIWFDKIKGDYTVVNVFTSYQTKHCATNRYNIALLNHNDSWCQSKIDKAIYNNVDYLEPLSSNAQKKLPYFKNKLTEYFDDDEWDELKMHKIFESAISKILVIDERIQRFANTDYVADNVNVPIKEIFIDTNVIVPDYTTYPLDADNFKEDRVDNICNYIDEQVNNSNFMLIHFGILERMYKNEMNTIDSKLKEWATKTRVIVTSGRGKPREHLPREVCYVNLSPVLNVFTQTRSKYAMNYLLNQSRQ